MSGTANYRDPGFAPSSRSGREKTTVAGLEVGRRFTFLMGTLGGPAKLLERREADGRCTLVVEQRRGGAPCRSTLSGVRPNSTVYVLGDV